MAALPGLRQPGRASNRRRPIVAVAADGIGVRTVKPWANNPNPPAPTIHGAPSLSLARTAHNGPGPPGIVPAPANGCRFSRTVPWLSVDPPGTRTSRRRRQPSRGLIPPTSSFGAPIDPPAIFAGPYPRDRPEERTNRGWTTSTNWPRRDPFQRSDRPLTSRRPKISRPNGPAVVGRSVQTPVEILSQPARLACAERFPLPRKNRVTERPANGIALRRTQIHAPTPPVPTAPQDFQPPSQKSAAPPPAPAGPVVHRKLRPPVRDD